LTKAAQRIDSPAADSGKTTNHNNYFAGKVLQRTHAEEDQVQPVLGCLWQQTKLHYLSLLL
jgi:hypothetical protein